MPAVPSSPTGVSAQAGNASATISFNPPVSDGGSPITTYTATCTATGQTTRTTTATSSPLTVTNLTNNTTYNCSVTATNVIGTSSASNTASVTPTAPSSNTRITTGLTSLYEFNETSGNTVTDTSGVGTPLNLTIANPANTTRLPGALRINTATTISSAVAASKITNPSKTSGGMTFEAWVEPTNTTQTGSAASPRSPPTPTPANRDRPIRHQLPRTTPRLRRRHHHRLQPRRRPHPTPTRRLRPRPQRHHAPLHQRHRDHHDQPRQPHHLGLQHETHPRQRPRHHPPPLARRTRPHRHLQPSPHPHRNQPKPHRRPQPHQHHHPTPNDDFANATQIAWAPTGQITGTTVGATREPDEAVTGGTARSGGPSPSTNGTVEIKSLGQPGLYTGNTLSSLVRVADGEFDDDGVSTTLRTRVAAGVTYRLVVATGTEAALTLVWGSGTPPPNDDRALATTLSNGLTGVVVQDITWATVESSDPYLRYPRDRSAWWRWTPATSGTVHMVEAADSDPMFAVYSGANATTTVATARPNASGSASDVTFNVVAGTTYSVITTNRTGANIALAWEQVTPPVNDNFANATTVTGAPPVFIAPTTPLQWATAEPGEDLGSESAKSVWFRWTAPTTTWIHMVTAGGPGVRLGVSTGSSLTNLTSVVTSSRRWTSGSGFELWFKAVAGTTYRISADDPDGGTVALVWEHVSPPPNDDLANAAVVPWTASGTTSGSNHTASLEVGEPAHAAPGGRSVWWTTTSAATGYATLNTSGSNFDTTLAVYTGTSIAGLVPVGSNDDSNGTVQSEVRFLATAGTTYRIAVDGFQGKTGEIALNWSFPIAAAPGAPTGVSAQAGNASTTISFNPPVSDGGSPITTYTATCTATGQTTRTTTATSSPLTVTNLTNNTTYNCSVTATNAIGTSSASNTASVTPTAPSSNTRITTGLTSLYEFNETSGNTVTDTSGVGTPLNLTIANPANTTRLPGALRINTATTISSAVAASKITNPSKTSGGMTFEAWVKPANTTQTGPARIAAIATDTNTRNIEIAQSATNYHGRLRGSAGGTITAYSPGADPTQLQHVVFVRDPNGTMRLYINGTETTTATSPGNLTTWDSNMKLTLANVLGTTPRPWLGELDLIATYNRALTPTEISQNHTAGPNPTNTTTRPPNDNFANATPVNADLTGAVVQDTTSATGEPGEPGGVARSVWWRWTPTTSGWVHMVAVGAKDFPSFAVYTGGTLPTLVEVAAGRQKLGDTKAQDARFEVTAGTSYSIRASNADGGDVAVGWEPFINPPNDNFSSPTQIPWAPSGSIAGTTWGATSQPGEPAHAGSPAGSMPGGRSRHRTREW